MAEIYTARVKKEFKGSKKLIAAVVAVLAAVVFVSSCVAIVPAGHTGVVLTLGKVSDGVMQEGFHVKAPFIQRVVSMSNQIQKCEVDGAESVSKDLQAISSTIVVNYRIEYASAASVYKNIGTDYESIVLLPAVQESLKSVTAGYTAEELITLRAQVAEEIKETLEAKVSDNGLIIEKFNIVNFSFSEEFNAAIEAKQVAEQNLIKTKTEQEQAIVIAEAEAKKKVIAAEAEAQAILAEAQAQAEANRQLSQSLSDTLVEYQKVQKWDGVLPKATGGSSIIDMRESDGE